MLLNIFSFGFLWTNTILKIKSIITSVPLSLSFGISSYIFLTHSLSYLFGPQKASYISLILMLISNIILYILKKANATTNNDLSKKQAIILYTSASIIFLLSFLSLHNYGIFDLIFHEPVALTLFHNDVYPPRDYFRPAYVLLYHFGGDLFAGSINHITHLDIARCFELMSTLCSGINFLSYIALAWVITKNFKTSYIAGFCTYFGGGLLWLDTIFRYFSKDLPPNLINASFLELLTSIGIHGSVINAPAILAFSSTSSLGIHMLIFSLIVFWFMLNNNQNSLNLIYLLTLSISLLSLSICAEWLYLTFFMGALPILVIHLIKKDFTNSYKIITLTIISFFLNKTIGNALFLQDGLQKIGRTSILNIGIKEKLFEISAWGRLTPLLNNYVNYSCFSWDFLSEFGLSLIFLPIAIYFILKEKNTLVYLLFFCTLFTMPTPTILDFRTNPTDFNRMFCFGNQMLILFITCGLFKFFKAFFSKKINIALYIFLFCFSPLCQLILGSIFTPYIYSAKDFSKIIFSKLYNSNNLTEIISTIHFANATSSYNRNHLSPEDYDSIKFLQSHSKKGDTAISTIPEIPYFAGIYSFVPARTYIYQDQIYSPFSSIFSTVLNSFDPYLLKELNIKWLIIKTNKNIIIPENLFNLVYSKDSKNYSTKIFHIKDLNNTKDFGERKAGWILINKNGQPLELFNLGKNKVTIFKSMRDSLKYLKSLYLSNSSLNKELITSQPVLIQELNSQIQTVNKTNNLNIELIFY